jgi:hypothetical protein
MNKLFVITLLVILFSIGLGIWYKNYKNDKSDDGSERGENKDNKESVNSQTFLTGLATPANTFNETSGIDEHIKMTYGPVLKNTVMSKKPLRKLSDFTMSGPFIGPTGNGNIPIHAIIEEPDPTIIGFYARDGQYTKVVLYNLSSGEKIRCIYKITSSSTPWTDVSMNVYNINTTIPGGMTVALAELKNFYPNYIREGLFYIKVGNGLVSNSFYRGNVLPEYGTKKVNNDSEKNNVINFERERFKNTHSAITDSNGDKPNPALIPFMLSLVSKDDVNMRYVFEIRDFRGKVYKFNQYKRCELFGDGPTNKEVRLCNDWSYDDNCVVVTPGYYPTFDNDRISVVETSYGAKATLYEHVNKGGATRLIDEHSRVSFGGGDWWNDRTSYYDVVFYNYVLMRSTSASSNVSSRIVVEFENGKMYIRNNSGYFYNYDRGSEPGGRLRFGEAGIKEECELIPVLDATLADSYLRASLNYLNRPTTNLQNLLNSVESNDPLAEPFCGRNERFRDDTLKINLGIGNAIDPDPITGTFEKICACNMDKGGENDYGFYIQKLCSDDLILREYGISDKRLYTGVRDTLKCNTPNCRFQKCKLMYDLTDKASRVAAENITGNFTDRCGYSNLCIANQTFTVNGSLENSTVNQSAEVFCGLAGENGVGEDVNNNLSWLPNTTITSTQTVSLYSEGDLTGSEVKLSPGFYTIQDIGFQIKSLKIPAGFSVEFKMDNLKSMFVNTIFETQQTGVGVGSDIQTVKIGTFPIASSITTGTGNVDFSILESSNKNYRLKLEADGNLSIIKKSDNSIIWSVKDIGKYSSGIQPPYRITQQTDGNLVIYGLNNGVVFSSASTNKWSRGAILTPYTTRLLDTGVLETRDGNNTLIWSSQ